MSYVIATCSQMFRAPEGARHPWTASIADARRFMSEAAARLEIASHAAFTGRPTSDYRLYNEAPDGRLVMLPTTYGGRIIDRAVTP